MKKFLKDREALRELDRQIQALWSQQIPERGAFTATTLLLLDRQFERARPLLDKLSSQSNSSVKLKFKINSVIL